MDRETFMTQLELYHKQKGGSLSPSKLLGHRIDLYEMFRGSMRQGGFPRVNKNSKWGHIAKSINIVPKDKPVSSADQEQIKKFYVKWIRGFEGDCITQSMKKQLIPPGMELPPRRKKVDAMQFPGKNASGVFIRPDDPKFSRRDRTRRNERSSQAATAGGSESQTLHTAKIGGISELQEQGEVFPVCTDLWRLALGIQNRGNAPADFIFCLNCLYFISRPPHGIRIAEHPTIVATLTELMCEVIHKLNERAKGMEAPSGILSLPEMHNLLTFIVKSSTEDALSPLTKEPSSLQDRFTNTPAQQVAFKFSRGILHSCTAILTNLVQHEENRLYLAGRLPLPSYAFSSLSNDQGTSYLSEFPNRAVMIPGGAATSQWNGSSFISFSKDGSGGSRTSLQSTSNAIPSSSVSGEANSASPLIASLFPTPSLSPTAISQGPFTRQSASCRRRTDGGVVSTEGGEGSSIRCNGHGTSTSALPASASFFPSVGGFDGQGGINDVHLFYKNQNLPLRLMSQQVGHLSRYLKAMVTTLLGTTACCFSFARLAELLLHQVHSNATCKVHRTVFKEDEANITVEKAEPAPVSSSTKETLISSETTAQTLAGIVSSTPGENSELPAAAGKEEDVMKISVDTNDLQANAQILSATSMTTASRTVELPAERTILPVFQTLSDTGNYLFGSPVCAVGREEGTTSVLNNSVLLKTQSNGNQLLCQTNSLQTYSNCSPSNRVRAQTSSLHSHFTTLATSDTSKQGKWLSEAQKVTHAGKEDDSMHSQKVPANDRVFKHCSYQRSKRIASLSIYDAFFRTEQVEPNLFSIYALRKLDLASSIPKKESKADTATFSYSTQKHSNVFDSLSQQHSSSSHKDFSVISGASTLEKSPSFYLNGIEGINEERKEHYLHDKNASIEHVEEDVDSSRDFDALSALPGREELKDGPFVRQDKLIDSSLENVRFDTYRDAILLHKWIQPFIEIAIASTSSLTALTSLLPSETWLASEILAVICNLVFSLQNISGFRLPFLFINGLGFELLRNTLELGCQMVLFKHLMLATQLRTFLTLAASVFDLETACPDIEVPIGVIKAALTFCSLTCEHLALDIVTLVEGHLPIKVHAATALENCGESSLFSKQGCKLSQRGIMRAADLFLSSLMRYLRQSIEFSVKTQTTGWLYEAFDSLVEDSLAVTEMQLYPYTANIASLERCPAVLRHSKKRKLLGNWQFVNSLGFFSTTDKQKLPILTMDGEQRLDSVASGQYHVKLLTRVNGRTDASIHTSSSLGTASLQSSFATQAVAHSTISDVTSRAPWNAHKGVLRGSNDDLPVVRNEFLVNEGHEIPIKGIPMDHDDPLVRFFDGEQERLRQLLLNVHPSMLPTLEYARSPGADLLQLVKNASLPEYGIGIQNTFLNLVKDADSCADVDTLPQFKSLRENCSAQLLPSSHTSQLVSAGFFGTGRRPRPLPTHAMRALQNLEIPTSCHETFVGNRLQERKSDGHAEVENPLLASSSPLSYPLHTTHFNTSIASLANTCDLLDKEVLTGGKEVFRRYIQPVPHHTRCPPSATDDRHFTLESLSSQNCQEEQEDASNGRVAIIESSFTSVQRPMNWIDSTSGETRNEIEADVVEAVDTSVASVGCESGKAIAVNGSMIDRNYSRASQIDSELVCTAFSTATSHSCGTNSFASLPLRKNFYQDVTEQPNLASGTQSDRYTTDLLASGKPFVSEMETSLRPVEFSEKRTSLAYDYFKPLASFQDKSQNSKIDASDTSINSTDVLKSFVHVENGQAPFDDMFNREGYANILANNVVQVSETTRVALECFMHLCSQHFTVPLLRPFFSCLLEMAWLRTCLSDSLWSVVEEVLSLEINDGLDPSFYVGTVDTRKKKISKNSLSTIWCTLPCEVCWVEKVADGGAVFRMDQAYQK